MSAIDILSKVINTDLGLEYCGEDEDFYEEMLQEYIDGDKTEMLNRYFADSNWTDYRVQIHAVKSTSLMIGAEDLSAKAKELEMAAAQSDVATLQAKHASVLAEYKTLMDTIKSAIEA
ncbi:MAG: hypothetical protein MJ104_03365 [Lachnospiraceae bacterium]|nr:hypothetical protein [Lachnospiraceae bacterium]